MFPDRMTHLATSHGFGLSLLAAFVGGLALNFTPCVYPMIPVTVAFFSGQAPGSLPRTALLAGVYVIGMSLCYAVLGLLAAKTGVLVGSWLQQPVVLVGMAVVVTLLSLGMFGVYELRPPQALTRRLTQASAGLPGAFIMGGVVGLVAAPCIGPFVLGLLLLAGQLANAVEGFLLFFVLGLGMGLPYVALGVAANRLSRLPKAGEWLVWSKHVLGVVLLGLALYFLKPLLPTRALRLATEGLLLGGGVYLGWWARAGSHGRFFRWLRRGLGSCLVLAALILGWPRAQVGSAAVAWIPYSQAAFEQARRDQRPILIDVYADWCLPCVELDRVTFRHPDVARALDAVATLRLDATREVSPEASEFLDRHAIYGVPTALLFDRRGNERRELRLVGFVGPKAFLRRLAQIQ